MEKEHPRILRIPRILRYPPPIPKDLYALLGLSRDASPDDIKKAYRNMSKEWHPDKHKGDKGAEDKFKEINEAYEVLSNPERKQMYDQFGSTGNGGGAGGQGFGGFDFSGFQNAQDLGDIFGSFFGNRAQGRRREGGENRAVELTIDFNDVVHGAQKAVRFRRLAPCATCSGTGGEPGTQTIKCDVCGGTGQVERTVSSFFGQIRQRSVCEKCHGTGTIPEKPCHTCKGEGRVSDTTEVTVNIPPGIDDGQALRISNYGDAGLRGQPAGDLHVHISIRPDPRFQREGADIHTAVAIPVIDAILGGQTIVETVHGPSAIEIPESMQPGITMRLKGKGLPVLSSSRMGDHYVTVNVSMPKKLSKKERKILEEWKEERE